jgi:amidase
VPAGFIGPLPVGVSFIGGRWDEPRLLALAYAFEQATKVREPPQFIPTIGDDAPSATASAAAQATPEAAARNGTWRMPPLR